MNALTHTLVLSLLIIAAVGCYTIGVQFGGHAFLLLGGVLETVFWYGAYQRNKTKKRSAS